jgi:hypothetical protein
MIGQCFKASCARIFSSASSAILAAKIKQNLLLGKSINLSRVTYQ